MTSAMACLVYQIKNAVGVNQNPELCHVARMSTDINCMEHITYYKYMARNLS